MWRGRCLAEQFVTHVTKAMLHEAQFHIAEGKFDALVKRAKGYLEKHGGSADCSTLHMCDAIIEES